MVSKASEDLPEPDSPVNTTSRSRGISTSMFFRLCSRAPRMVMAREEAALGWRLARSTSSISAFPDAHETRLIQARFAGRAGLRRQRGSPERRKNGRHFPVPRANHQRLVCGVAAGGSRCAVPGANKKGRREAGLFENSVQAISVLSDDRAAPAIVDADGDEVDVLLDA